MYSMVYSTSCGITFFMNFIIDGVWKKKKRKKEEKMKNGKFDKMMKGALGIHSIVHVECKSERVFEIG